MRSGDRSSFEKIVEENVDPGKSGLKGFNSPKDLSGEILSFVTGLRMLMLLRP